MTLRIFTLILFTNLQICVLSQLNDYNSSFYSKSGNFVENKGQMQNEDGKSIPFVLFQLEAHGLNMYITETGISYIFYQKDTIKIHNRNKNELTQEDREGVNYQWERIDLILENANIKKENIIRQYESTQGHLNYFNSICPNGIYEVKEYEKIVIKNIYPNIDWELYHTSSNGYKYDFVLYPGARSEDINLIYRGKEPIVLSNNGDIVNTTKFGSLIEEAPITYFNDQLIQSKFEISQCKQNEFGGYDNHIKFIIDKESTELIEQKSLDNFIIIDPTLVWSTFYGGELADGAMSIAIDDSNDVYIGGYCKSISFPVYDNDSSYFQGTMTSTWSGIILKFDNNGKRKWATFYDGNNTDEIRDIALDKQNNLLVGGHTESDDLPVFDNGTFFQPNKSNGADGFILKFNMNGQRIWATYFGGTGTDQLNAIVVDHDDRLLLVGSTNSVTFPYMDAGTYFQTSTLTSQHDAFIAQFDSNGNQIWATALGGISNISQGGAGNDGGFGIDVDSQNNIYITGRSESPAFPLINSGNFFDSSLNGYVDGFLTKFDQYGNMIWGTQLGGNNTDFGKGIKVDFDDNILVSGFTNSNDFPASGSNHGGSDAFLMKFNPSGNQLWSKYIGGQSAEYYWADNILAKQEYNKSLAIDACNNIFFSFETTSSDLVTMPFYDDGYYKDHINGNCDQFIMELSPEGNLKGASYLGGDGEDFRCSIALDKNGNLWTTGEWSNVNLSSSYPIVLPDSLAYSDSIFNGYPDDIFIAKLEFSFDHQEACGFTTPPIIIEPSLLTMPNVFTPNGDSINDIFNPVLISGIDEMKTTILNRWGQVVFETNNPLIGWDGRDMGGKMVVDGTYFWIVRYTNHKQRRIEEHGIVDVKR